MKKMKCEERIHVDFWVLSAARTFVGFTDKALSTRLCRQGFIDKALPTRLYRRGFVQGIRYRFVDCIMRPPGPQR